MPEVFGRIEDITLAGFLIRTVIVGCVGYLVGRNVYKRAVNQLTTYDFALIWILGAITVSPVLDGKVSFTYMFVPLLTLFFWHTAFSFISLKNRTFSFFFNGKPAILIDNGKVVVKNLKRQFISVDLLLSELRIHNVFDVSEVKYAILEPNAHISVMKFDAGSAVTPADMNLPVKPSHIPLIIINEGKFIPENLEKAGVDESWVLNQLNMKHVKDIKSVFLATMDSSKKVYQLKKG
ncbi:YetF domain-containing protein [Rossellomorea aquimaris]|jgi:uncharacterized membrane protein YcaP (DUF421 family)|uniref:YetF C-terminal domain-containing protein n=1 Tax=Rossellomorea aquimaris TaxID=189382 RepID=A0A1J6VNQ7_9BACI|nr:DUF421 domain-containing protein [Rossellomorea aquimaris]OIU66957.1 hypothetical protein BHE18_13715 [Rossellomorea aquimaris]